MFFLWVMFWQMSIELRNVFQQEFCEFSTLVSIWGSFYCLFHTDPLTRRLSPNQKRLVQYFQTLLSIQSFWLFLLYYRYYGASTLWFRWIVCEIVSSVHICCFLSSFSSVSISMSTTRFLSICKFICFCFKLKAFGLFGFLKKNFYKISGFLCFA